MEDIKKKIDEIDELLTKHINWICEHLQSDTDDFTGYYTKESINEDSFHIPFNEIEKKLDKLKISVEQVEKEAKIEGRQEAYMIVKEHVLQQTYTTSINRQPLILLLDTLYDKSELQKEDK